MLVLTMKESCPNNGVVVLSQDGKELGRIELVQALPGTNKARVGFTGFSDNIKIDRLAVWNQKQAQPTT